MAFDMVFQRLLVAKPVRYRNSDDDDDDYGDDNNDAGICEAFVFLVKCVAKMKVGVCGETSSAPGDTTSKVHTLPLGYIEVTGIQKPKN
ncbi:hypothetical protein TURU_009154 [Turdus rufiventris]|nr:hypothetical protein TURU_009154 [Turdus rufiventris]